MFSKPVPPGGPTPGTHRSHGFSLFPVPEEGEGTSNAASTSNHARPAATQNGAPSPPARPAQPRAANRQPERGAPQVVGPNTQFNLKIHVSAQPSSSRGRQDGHPRRHPHVPPSSPGYRRRRAPATATATAPATVPAPAPAPAAAAAPASARPPPAAHNPRVHFGAAPSARSPPAHIPRGILTHSAHPPPAHNNRGHLTSSARPPPAHTRVPFTPSVPPPPAHSNSGSLPPAAAPAPQYLAPPAEAASQYRSHPGYQVRYPRPAPPPQVYVHSAPIMGVIVPGPGYVRPLSGTHSQTSPGYYRTSDPRNWIYTDASGQQYVACSGDAYQRAYQSTGQQQYIRPQPVYANGMHYQVNPNSGASQSVAYPYAYSYYGGAWHPVYYSTYGPSHHGVYGLYYGGQSLQNNGRVTSAVSGSAPPNVQQHGSGHMLPNAAVIGDPRGFQNYGGGTPIYQQTTQYNLPQTGTGNFYFSFYLNPQIIFPSQVLLCTYNFSAANGQQQQVTEHYFYPPVSNPVQIGLTIDDGSVNCYMMQGAQGQNYANHDAHKRLYESLQHDGLGDYGRAINLEQHLDNFCNNLQGYHELYRARNAQAPGNGDEQEQHENLSSSSSCTSGTASSCSSPEQLIDIELSGRIVNDALDVLNDPREDEVTSSGIGLAE